MESGATGGCSVMYGCPRVPQREGTDTRWTSLGTRRGEMGPDRVRGEPLGPGSSQHTQTQPVEFPSSWVEAVEPLRKARV